MKKRILVSGSHRSGSTWLGKILSLADDVNYVHEPFNLTRYKNTPFTYWFEYISNNSSKKYQRKVKSYLKYYSTIFHYKNLEDILKIRSLKNARRVFYRLKDKLKKSTVLKDPIAIMSVEWIYKEFDCDVVILIRHPAAFVASLKVKDWHFDFNDFLQQKELMATYLAPFKEEIEHYANNKQDLISQGVLLWKTIYSTIYSYQQNHKDWYFIKHEDLSLNPIEEFDKIFKYLDIDFNEKIKAKLLGTTISKENIGMNRNSKENISTWKTRLTPDEIDKIKKGTYNVWTKFYTEQDW